jgi:hypothetical protein
MEQLVILLVIGAISLINWLLNKSAEHKKRQGRTGRPVATGRAGGSPPWAGPDVDSSGGFPPAPQPSAPGPAEPDEQMRRFLEALGIPPPVGEIEEPEVSLPFEAEPTPPPLPVPKVVAAGPAKPSLRANREMRELAAEFERSALDAASDTGSVAVFRDLLSSPQMVRQGIILREILGPPKALEF